LGGGGLMVYQIQMILNNRITLTSYFEIPKTYSHNVGRKKKHIDYNFEVKSFFKKKFGITFQFS
jgi:hypothetical protein